MRTSAVDKKQRIIWLNYALVNINELSRGRKMSLVDELKITTTSYTLYLEGRANNRPYGFGFSPTSIDYGL